MNVTITTLPENLICFSHLRWDFVYQRPQHLLSRFAQHVNVYFFEEPEFDAIEKPQLSIVKKAEKLHIVVPHLVPGTDQQQGNSVLAILLDQLLKSIDMEDCTFWYYTPMPLAFSYKFKPRLILYDCMDELSAFKFAPPDLVNLENQLLARADLVFTGGHSLYEAKKNHHANIFSFPSSIDGEHFRRARTISDDPEDQRHIQGIKIGFHGVIDERFDLELIYSLATKRPEWQILLIGPVVKIDPNVLPQAPNIHYLGQKSYEILPFYLAGWDIAMIPFQLNESTRYISPTKTPEYLSAGIPVISTPIRDVVKPYGIRKLVRICSTSDEFIKEIEAELSKENKRNWLKDVDTFLKQSSWDKTYQAMTKQMITTLNNTAKISIAS